MCICINLIICMKPNRLFRNKCAKSCCMQIFACFRRFFFTDFLYTVQTMKIVSDFAIPSHQTKFQQNFHWKNHIISNRDRFKNRWHTPEVGYLLLNHGESQQTNIYGGICCYCLFTMELQQFIRIKFQKSCSK